MDLKEKITECIVDVLKVDREKVEKLSGDEPLRILGMDSLNCIDIVVGVEQSFDICFNDEELLLENINTLNKLCKIVQQKLGDSM
jgi:acyl carrier protein